MRTKDITFTIAVAIAVELYAIERGAFAHSATEGVLDKNWHQSEKIEELFSQQTQQISLGIHTYPAGRYISSFVLPATSIVVQTLISFYICFDTAQESVAHT
jgi:hypothetical protein